MADKIRLYGEICPFCRKINDDLMELYDGDWKQTSWNTSRLNV